MKADRHTRSRTRGPCDRVKKRTAQRSPTPGGVSRKQTRKGKTATTRIVEDALTRPNSPISSPGLTDKEFEDDGEYVVYDAVVVAKVKMALKDQNTAVWRARDALQAALDEPDGYEADKCLLRVTNGGARDFVDDISDGRDVAGLEAELKKKDAQLKDRAAEVERLREQLEELEERARRTQEQADKYLTLRGRFLSNFVVHYNKPRGSRTKLDTAMINAGNALTHDGNCKEDVRLFTVGINGKRRTDSPNFERLYGFTVDVVENRLVCKATIAVVDTYATIMCDDGRVYPGTKPEGGKDELILTFQRFVGLVKRYDFPTESNFPHDLRRTYDRLLVIFGKLKVEPRPRMQTPDSPVESWEFKRAGSVSSPLARDSTPDMMQSDYWPSPEPRRERSNSAWSTR